jgi:hypothetical protein
MSIDLKRYANREEWEHLLRRLRRLPPVLVGAVLVSHIRMAKIGVTLLVLVVAIYLMIILLYLPPPGVVVAEPEVLRLDTALIDRLTSWLAQREALRGGELTVPDDLFL